jgi:hypothetical protein
MNASTHAFASLEDRHLAACSSEVACSGEASEPRSDDHHIDTHCVRHALRSKHESHSLPALIVAMDG